MKKTLLATTVLAVSGFVAGEAAAVDVSLYGQVNKLVMFQDDGQNVDFSIADNDNSSTRFGFKGSQVLDNGLTASVLWEGEYQTNSSRDLSQNITAGQSTTPENTISSLDARHARVGLAGSWGAVFVGHQSTATDSVSEQDLVGVRDMMQSRVARIGGGFTFREDGSTTDFVQINGGDLDGVDTVNDGSAQIQDLANNFDGNGRADAVRYDSPIFSGFQGRASVAQGGDIDVAGYYNGSYDAIAVKAAIGYVMNNDQNTLTADRWEDQLSGSVSIGHENGVAGTFAYGRRTLASGEKTANNDDPKFWYAKLGYSWDAFEAAIDYGKYSEMLTAVTGEHNVTAMGLGGQYNMGNGVSVSGMYRNFELDAKNNAGTAVNAEDISLYTMGLRVKF